MVQEHLERILASAAFRSSQRSQQFLRFVVLTVLEHDRDSLKERTVGVCVFGRRPDYDTRDDAIVRVKANEIRKRLLQYYSSEGAHDELRIELAPGSYIPEFHKSPPESVPEPEPFLMRATTSGQPNRKRWRWWVLAIVGTVVVVAVAGLLTPRSLPSSPLDTFWSPVLASPKPVVICGANPTVYGFSPRFYAEYRAQHGIDQAEGPSAFQFKPDRQIVWRDLVTLSDQFIGVGDATTAASVMAMLASRRKPAILRLESGISFGDLRSGPAVLIGAFSNAWTMQMGHELRYFFEAADGTRRIRDRTSAGRVWAPSKIGADGKPSDDYAIVARVLDSRTGELLITIAGVTQYGTGAAGEFLTSEVRMREAFKDAPKDWRTRNVEVVLHTIVTGNVPGPPTAVAVHVW